MKKGLAARDAYVRAEIETSIATQIRAIRMQRNWSQADLAKRLGTTQAAVSRMEDPSYGRLSIKTLLDLSKAFDAGLRVQFVSLVSMLNETFKPKAQNRLVPSFEEEAPGVGFYTSGKTYSPMNVETKSVVFVHAYGYAGPKITGGPTFWNIDKSIENNPTESKHHDRHNQPIVA